MVSLGSKYPMLQSTGQLPLEEQPPYSPVPPFMMKDFYLRNGAMSKFTEAPIATERASLMPDLS